MAPRQPVIGGNVFTTKSAQANDEVGERFTKLLATPLFELEQIVSTGQATPEGEWLEQERSEWVALLTGQATLRFAAATPAGSDSVVELKPGDYVAIPAGCRHRVDATSSTEPSVWLAIHYDAIGERG